MHFDIISDVSPLESRIPMAISMSTFDQLFLKSISFIEQYLKVYRCGFILK